MQPAAVSCQVTEGTHSKQPAIFVCFAPPHGVISDIIVVVCWPAQSTTGRSVASFDCTARLWPPNDS